MNDLSAETVASLVPRLRVGMSHEELRRLLAEKNTADPKTGKHSGTLMFGWGVVWLLDENGREIRDQNGERQPDPTRWYCLLYLRDANLKVILDKKDRILSWSVEPVHR